jgi:hypothetical protein
MYKENLKVAINYEDHNLADPLVSCSSIRLKVSSPPLRSQSRTELSAEDRASKSRNLHDHSF